MGELAFSVLQGIEGVTFDYEGDPDIIFSASYPHRIPQDDCARAALGAVNLHTGLLPEGRGWHPLNWAIIWGKEVTGITIHKIAESFDAGDVCVQHEVPIFISDTIRELRARVDAMVPQVIAAFFEKPEFYIRAAMPQNQALVSYAPKRLPEDSHINVLAPWRDIYNLWRSCDPDEYPAFVMQNGKKKIVKRVYLSDRIEFL